MKFITLFYYSFDFLTGIFIKQMHIKDENRHANFNQVKFYLNLRGPDKGICEKLCEIKSNFLKIR